MFKRIYIVAYFFFGLILSVYAQNFSGQWKGEFIDKSTSRGNFSGEKCEYVLELDVNGNTATGSSYTYFTENGKRFYTICKVEGTIENKKKYIEIKETERIKTNIPLNITNCFQVHKLTYFKKGDEETMEGNWVPSPNQKGNCGFGITNLTRRTLIKNYPGAYAKVQNNATTKPTSNPIVKGNIAPKTKIEKATKSTTAKIDTDSNNDLTKTTNPLKTEEIIESTTKESEKIIQSIEDISKLEKRKNLVLKTIEVESSNVKIDLYDNGEIDGDSISLFYNGKLLLSNKRLTDKSISLNLPVQANDETNELIMFAENLGSVAPNTALMVVTDGSNRYEIRITSDLEKSGVIRFIHKVNKQ
jgi:hypothetical protein